jgi:hypothetical protein
MAASAAVDKNVDYATTNETDSDRLIFLLEESLFAEKIGAIIDSVANSDNLNHLLSCWNGDRDKGVRLRKWTFFQMVPKPFLSVHIFSTRCEYDILKVL